MKITFRVIVSLFILCAVSAAKSNTEICKIKRFPFIRYEKIWQNTPAATEDVAIPNVYILAGKEDPEVLESISSITFFLGQWTDAEGNQNLTIHDKRTNKYLKKNLIVIGGNNLIAHELGLNCKKACLKVVKDADRNVLFVGGSTPEEIIKAINSLSKILSFKVGAYNTFFSWVKLRGLIEHKEINAALDLLENPRGIRACGRNMAMAAPMIKRLPEKVKMIIKLRNRIMYKDLPEALKKGDIEKAKKLWIKATVTCFKCHHGVGIKRMRTFSPAYSIHARHQRIARRFGLTCKDCHKGITMYEGYLPCNATLPLRTKR